MSDTKTLGEKLTEAKKQAHGASEAKWLADHEVGSLERRLAHQAEDFAKLQQDPDYQQATLASWERYNAVRKASGLSMEDFVRLRWDAEADDHATHLRLIQERSAAERFAESVNAAKAKALADTGGGPPPAPCSCGPMEACQRCPEVQAPPEAMAHAEMQAEDNAKQKGVNSVARGEPKQSAPYSIDGALTGLFVALTKQRAANSPLDVVLEVDRPSMMALEREYRMRWPHLPIGQAHGGGAFQLNRSGGRLLVREKK